MPSYYSIILSLSEYQLDDLVKFWEENGESIRNQHFIPWQTSDYMRLMLIPDGELVHIVDRVVRDELRRRRNVARNAEWIKMNE